MFKISSIVAALVVSGMLVGCGSSNHDGSGTTPGGGDGTTTPEQNTSTEQNTTVPNDNVTVGNCTFTTKEVKVGEAFEASKHVVVLDANKKPVAKFTVEGTVDKSVAAEYPVTVKSESCTNDGVVVVKVVEKATSGTCSKLPGASNPCKK